MNCLLLASFSVSNPVLYLEESCRKLKVDKVHGKLVSVPILCAVGLQGMDLLQRSSGHSKATE